MNNYEIIEGNALNVADLLEEKSMNTCVTSPPYFNLRNYGVEGQMGNELTPEEYVDNLVRVFRGVRKVLRDDGTIWLNLGDSYAGGGNGAANYPDSSGEKQSTNKGSGTLKGRNGEKYGLKPKNLIGIPWRVAFALQADGWYLRQDIIWCLSGGTYLCVKSQKGVTPMMVTDMVRLNPSTVQLWNGEKWTQVLGWGKNTDPKEKIELVLRSGERIGCTGEHLWPTQRGNVAASELMVGDKIKTCRLPEPELANIPAYLTEDALWFIGLYLAEGSRSNDTIQIAGHAKETLRLERIQGLTKHYGGSCTYTVKGNKLDIRVYGKILNAIINQFISGKEAKTKGFAPPVWSLTNQGIRWVVEGYLSGDGHDDSKNKRYRLGFCRNYNLERDLRMMAARLGATITLNSGFSASQNGKHPSFRGEWRWGVSNHLNNKDRAEIREIRRSKGREFWDISVEDEPHLFALSSGVLTHNCKKNPMPESVTDRCVKAHEYIFLFSKKAKYYFDHLAIKEPAVGGVPGNKTHKHTSAYEAGDEMSRTKAGLVDYARKKSQSFKREGSKREQAIPGQSVGTHRPDRKESDYDLNTRNKRSVWTVSTKPYKEAHFAVFPPELITPCVLAGCPNGGIVLDVFNGSGTTGEVALLNGCNYKGIELNPEYITLTHKRLGSLLPKAPDPQT